VSGLFYVIKLEKPMFIPFLAASAIAAAFATLGAMSVKISVLTMALNAMALPCASPLRLSLCGYFGSA
jgi:hypothetical protein